MSKKVLIVVATVLCVALLAACGGGNAAADSIVGTWECRESGCAHDWFCNLVFDENGRFVDGDGDWGDYIIDGDSLTLEFDHFFPFTFNFSISGNRLTFTDDGARLTLHRV